jgi:hypothetical protein
MVLTDLVSFILRSATGVRQDGVKLEFIDEIFFSLICEAKHGVIASMSILTSLINGIVNSVDRANRGQASESHSQDQEAENAEAVRTLTAAATTNFLSQISLGVLYPFIVAKKTIMCHTDSFLSIFDVSGFQLRLSSGNFASNTESLVGKCLSEYHVESMQNPDSAESQASLNSIPQSMIADTATAIAQIPFERALHSLDGFFSYAIGIVSGLQDLIATADQRHCNLPDTEAHELATCSCGDTAVRIPLSRANQGMEDGAFWCSGMLSLISPMGVSYLAFNPYTYQEIVDILASTITNGVETGHDRYLRCISGNVDGSDPRACGKHLPDLPVLSAQGISIITVLTRCKSNYANSQWDDGAAALFASQDLDQFGVKTLALRDQVESARRSAISMLPPFLVECMTLSLSSNVGNDACLQDWLTSLTLRRQLFFEYNEITSLQGDENIAACRVFTGPAENIEDNQTQFKKCLDKYDAEGCTLGGMVWAGRSANRVPVASTHALSDQSDTTRFNYAEKTHKETYKQVDAILKRPGIVNWNAKNLELSLFTAEGDSLHQLFDALVLGPYARANMWPTDMGQELPRLDWFRDRSVGNTREFQLPCSGDALRGVTKAPFSCGSATRRAAIRFFMKDVFAGGSDDELQKAVELAVKEMIDNLKNSWLGQEGLDYGCNCADGSPNNVQCCSPDNVDGFVPSELVDSRYTTLSGNTLVAGLFRSIGNYVDNTLWTRTSQPLTKYNLDLKDITGDKQVTKPDPIWNTDQKILAAEYGMFRTDIPLLEYNEDEVALPFGGSHNNISLWRVCHGLLQQTLSTLPMGKDRLPIGIFNTVPFNANAFSGDDSVREIERVVREMTQAAWERSPLHYSHTMRHIPTDSLLCESEFARTDSSLLDEKSDVRKIIRSYVDNVDVVGSYSALPDISTVHPHAGGLGSMRRACLCGWAHEGQCYVPSYVCDTVPSSASETLVEYCKCDRSPLGVPSGSPIATLTHAGEAIGCIIPRPGSHADGDAVRDQLLAVWKPEWECDSMAPSESWGVLNSSSMQEWLLANGADESPVSVRDILEHGRAGLRIGSLDSVVRLKGWKKVLHPGKRKIPLTGPANSSLGQRWCVNNSHDMFPESFADRFVDELFPVAQGITENTGLAFCLRVVVEAARLRALELVADKMRISDDSDDDADSKLATIIQAQQAVLGRWRRRCMQQVDKFGMCVLRGVFDVSPQLEDAQSEETQVCPFDLTPATGLWLTPGCLVRHQAHANGIPQGDVQYFYPCLCQDCSTIPSPRVDITYLSGNAACKIPFNPRTFAKSFKHTASLFWPTDFTGEKDDATRASLEAKVALLHMNRRRLHTGMEIDHLLKTYTDASSAFSNAFGNAPETGTPWFEAEGIDGAGAKFCDLIHDWWPDAWEQPIGVHVTTPCHSSETTYRGFDTQFTTDRTDPLKPKMVYQHESLRDPIPARTNFGTSGLCRIRSVAMPVQEINSMRFCTRMDTLASADPSMPIRPTAGSPDGYDVESCATSNRGVPWDASSRAQLTTSRGKSAGVILSWPGEEETGWVWPLTKNSEIISAPKDEMVREWGKEGCGLPPLFTCQTDQDCIDNAMGAGVVLKCMGLTDPDFPRGVCMRSDVKCVNHRDCGADKMCAGDGECVMPVMAVENQRSEEVEMHVYATSCAAHEARDTYGHSPWEQVPDLLRAHGMCSHRKWFEYRKITESVCGVPPTNGMATKGICKMPTQEGNWPYTDSFENEIPHAKRSLQADGVLAVVAHTCDRDFMFLDGYSECQPHPDQVRMRKVVAPGESGNGQLLAGYYRPGRSFATYVTPANDTLDFARLPFYDNEQLGFLGTSKKLYRPIAGDVYLRDDVMLQRCSDIAQCSLQTWTVRGRQTVHRVKPTNDPYKLSDALKCGSFGYRIPKGATNSYECKLDTSVIPLYRIMCEEKMSQGLHTGCQFKSANKIQDTCRKLSTAATIGYLSRTNSGVEPIQILVNSLASAFVPWRWENIRALEFFFTQQECAKSVLTSMGNPPETTLYTDIAIDGGQTPFKSTGFYHFRSFSVYEVAPLWWVKCILFSTDAVFGDRSSTCDAWTEEIDVESRPDLWLIARIGMSSDTAVTAGLQAIIDKIAVVSQEFRTSMTSILETIYTSFNVDWAVTDKPLNPSCKSEITLNDDTWNELSQAGVPPPPLASRVHQAYKEGSFAQPIRQGLTSSLDIRKYWAGLASIQGDVRINEFQGIPLDIFADLMNLVTPCTAPWTHVDHLSSAGIVGDKLELYLLHCLSDDSAAITETKNKVKILLPLNTCTPTTESQRKCLYADADYDTEARRKMNEIGSVDYDPEELKLMFGFKNVPSATDKASTGVRTETSGGVGFAVCQPAVSTDTCSMRTSDGSVLPEYQALPSLLGGNKPANPTKNRRCFHANHECVRHASFSNRDQHPTGLHRVTHAMDHRISKYRYATIPKRVRFTIHSLALTQLADPAYEYTTVKEIVRGPDFDELQESQRPLPEPDRIRSYVESWNTAKSGMGSGEATSHIPCYLSDAYERNRRSSMPGTVLHLYKLDATPLVKGLSVALTQKEYGTAYWNVYPRIRYESVVTKDIEFESGDYATVRKYKKTPRAGTVGALPFAMFNDGQLDGGDQDAAYPAAIYTEDDFVYATTPQLVAMMERRFLVKDSLNYHRSRTVSCDGCIDVIQTKHRRWPTLGERFEDLPEWVHCHDTEVNSLPTLENLITTGHVSGGGDGDYIGTIAGADQDTFRQVVKGGLSIFFARYRDMVDGFDEDSFWKPSIAKVNHAVALKGWVKENKIEWLQPPTEFEKTRGVNSFPGDSRDAAVMQVDDAFLDLYIARHIKEARLVYVAAKWPEESKKFFQVYNTKQTSKSFNTTVVPIPIDGVTGYTLELLQDHHCFDTGGEQFISKERQEQVCGVGSRGVVVSPNVVFCGKCTDVPKTICTGTIDCQSPKWFDLIHLYVNDDKKTEITNLLQTAAQKDIFELIVDAVRNSLHPVEASQSINIMIDIFKARLLQIHPDYLVRNGGGTGINGRLDIPLLDVLFNGTMDANPIGWSSWKTYNPISSLVYESTVGKIQANGALSPMACEEEDETASVDYRTCGQHEGIKFLNKTFIEKYTRDLGLRVPNKVRSSWEVSSHQLMGDGIIPFWAETKRDERDRFASWLLNFEHHCTKADMFHSVCMQGEDDAIHLFNPWLGGDFNAVDRCDSTFQPSAKGYVYDTRCPQEYCADSMLKAQSKFGLSQWKSLIQDDVSGDTMNSCWDNNGHPSSDRIVDDGQQNNLCSKTPRGNLTCVHKQGTLAGPGSPIDSVYQYIDNARQRLVVTSAEGTNPLGDIPEGGLFVEPRHAAFNGGRHSTSAGNAGTIRVDQFDIAGHHVRYVVDSLGLKVSEVLLGSYPDLDTAEKHTSDDIEWLLIDEVAETTTATPDIFKRLTWTDWVCPLRQQQFLQGIEPEMVRFGSAKFESTRFGMHFPDQRRAAVAFKKNNRGKPYHPTQKAGKASLVADAKYHSGNGVCACTHTEYDRCKFQVVSTDVCGFTDTVASLHDTSWRQSQVLQGGECTDQMDWPFTGGTMRDGSEMPLSQINGSTCGLFGRLPTYSYRYVNTPLQEARTGGDTTINDGGDCHTGRLAGANRQQGLNIGLSSDCHLLYRNDTHMVLGCKDRADPSMVVDVTLPRRQPDTPPEVLHHVQRLRRKCGQCSAPPTFEFPDGSQFPTAETSVTKPIRISTARKIASDLRNDLSFVLCGSLDGCPRLDSIIDRSQWVPGKFWDLFIGDVSSLLNTSAPDLKNITRTPSAPIPVLPHTENGGEKRFRWPTLHSVIEGSVATYAEEGEDDTELWQEPWLYCRQAESNCVQKIDQTTFISSEVCDEITTDQAVCTGTMSREDWMNPSTRTLSTIKAFTASIADTPDGEQSKPMNVCDLDGTLSDFCKDMQKARQSVFEANCRASGLCFDEGFFYQPSMFSMSNNQFVRQTVEDFYTAVDVDACSLQRTDRRERLTIQNAALAKRCPANTLKKFKDLLRTARAQAGSFIRAAYFGSLIVLNACRLMIPGSDASVQDAITQMGINLELMFGELGSMMMAGFNLLFDVLLDTPIGEWLENLMVEICKMINFLTKVFYLDFFCMIKVELTRAVQSIVDALFPIQVPILVKFIRDLEAVSCDPRKLLQSCSRTIDVEPPKIERIDAPTRCWSTYVNSLGDASSLSCSAADSCVQYEPGNMQAENGIVVCDDCKILPDLPDFQRYGCDIVRKQCKCAVQAISRTACINHKQCQNPEATCDLLDNAFSPTSFGTQPCDTCATGAAMCIHAPGGARCACPARTESLQTCSPDAVSSSVVPDTDALCLVTLGGYTTGTAASSSQYALAYEDLAAAPCSIITNPYCYTVYKSSWNAITFVVGLGTLNVRRRLLDEPDTINSRDEPDTFNSQRWNSLDDITAWQSLGPTVAGMIHIAPHDLERAAAGSWDSVRDEGCRLVGPIGSLVTFTNISVSDRILYKHCVRWRAIGDDVRRTFNLSVPDTFLLSLQDLADALYDPAVIVGLIRHPEIVLYTAMHTEIAAPVRSGMRSFRVWVMHSMAYIVEKIRWDDTQNITSTENSSDTFSHGSRVHTLQSLRMDLMRGAPALAAKRIDVNMPPLENEEASQDPPEPAKAGQDQPVPAKAGQDQPVPVKAGQDQPVPAKAGQDPREPAKAAQDRSGQPVVGQHTIRQLLSIRSQLVVSSVMNRQLLSFQSQLDQVKRYSTQLALQDGATILLGGSLDSAFADGPISATDVNYDVFNLKDGCKPVWNLFTLFQQTFSILAVYFTPAVPKRPPLQRDVFLSLPKFNMKYRNNTANKIKTFITRPEHSMAADIGRFFAETVAGIDSDFVRDVIDSIPGAVKSFIKCDIDSVMYCTQFRYSMLSSAIVVAAILFLGGMIVSSMGVPYTWTAVGLMYAPIVLFYSLGYSPFCAPMIPTCVGQEIIATFDTLIPLKIELPVALQLKAGCIEDLTVPAQDCIASCSIHPFNFRGWSEPVAWTLCELSPSICITTHTWLMAQSFAQKNGILFDLSTALWRSHSIITFADEDTNMAYRICAISSSWRSIPILFIVSFSAYLVPVLIVVPIQIILSSSQVLFATLFMSHMHVRAEN